jgi:hypothetical protein
LSSQTQAWKEYIPVYQDDAATDAWAVNSIGYIPYNYARFGDASLMLDFINGGSLDPRVTFTRASNATVTGPDGTLQYAPHNLLTFSEQFDNAAWTKNNLPITANTVVSPDGTTTADTINDTVDVSNAGHQFTRNVTVAAGEVYLASIYVRSGTGSGISIGAAGTGAFSTEQRVFFNSNTGIPTVQLGTPTNVVMTAVGGGWYRCSISLTILTSGTMQLVYRLYNSAGIGFYTGDGTQNVFIWGAQLNVGALQPYYPTTVKNLLGFTQEFDNAAWTKSNSFVQTNLCVNSEVFTSGYTLTGVTASADTAVSPTNVQSADSITETSATSQHILFKATDLAAVTSGTSYVFSIYAKANGRNFVQLFADSTRFGSNAWANFDLNTGAVGFIGAASTASIQNVGNGWFRCVMVCPATSTGNAAQMQVSLLDVDTNSRAPSYAGNSSLGVFIWGAQLVQGSTAGDYQRTDSTARAVMYPAPDGSMTADKLVENTASISHQTNQAFTPVNGGVYTGSIFVKAGERGFAFVGFTLGSIATTFITVDLSTGVVSNAEGTPLASSSVPLGNGWYRVSVSQASSGTTVSTFGVRTSVDGIYANRNYTGNGTSGIFIWGAQLSDSASLDPYVYNPGAAPTASAYYGPRFDYDPVTLQPKGLLIEEQRTNSIRNNTMVGAVAGTPGTLPTNWSVFSSGGLTTTVVGTGTSSGVNYVDLRFSGTSTAPFYVMSFDNSAVSASAGQIWAESFWVSLLGGSLANINSCNINIRWSGGATSDTSFVPTTTFNRVSGVGTVPSGTTAMFPALYLNMTNGAAIDFTLRIGMPQLELGAFATSVIPTTTAAATRAADVAVMTGANFSNWYNQTEGSFYAQHSQIVSGINGQIYAASDGTTNNRVSFRTASFAGLVTVGGVAQATIDCGSSGVANAVTNTSLAFRLNSINAALNGVLGSEDTSASIPTVSQLQLGQIAGVAFLNGHIRRIAYFPRRLANAELQAITS